MVSTNLRGVLSIGCAVSFIAAGAEAAASGTAQPSPFASTPFPDPFQFFLRETPFPSPASFSDSFGFLSRANPTDMFRTLTDSYRMAAAMPEQFLRAAADAATLLTMQHREHTQAREQPMDTPVDSSSPSRGFFIPGMPFYPANWMPVKSLFPLAENPSDWFNNFLFILWAAAHPTETAYYLKLAKSNKYPGWDYPLDGTYSHSRSSESSSYEGQYARQQKAPSN
ncbi:hypothetical protein BESB_049580 [Besnoitia besnoiti]|uniref:Transmembrane protein n=1 Tax=Besnoitia besnoiti TaxID=94643 RepID=A0A2A9ML75_BESBE|nr:hypothetical protein BESB_049580 [Besnoitia besnoiti]PFH36766.1 hypothetical protein BESB_049580 [Besnoitia besnoiti]